MTKDEQALEKARSIAAKIAELAHGVEELMDELVGRIRADRLIEERQLTLDKIELSDGEDVPVFGHCHAFSSWLSTREFKPFAEWAGWVFSVDPKTRRINFDDMICSINDLKEKNDGDENGRTGLADRRGDEHPAGCGDGVAGE